LIIEQNSRGWQEDSAEQLLERARRAVPNAVRAHGYYTETGRLVNLHVKKDDGGWCWRSIDHVNNGLLPHRLTVPGVETLFAYWRAKAELETTSSRVLGICEGEKDCETAWSHGKPAVCYPDGATGAKWNGLHTAAVVDVRPDLVVVIADNDVAGRMSAEHIAKSLEAAGLRVERRLPPTSGHDLTAHIEAGGAADGLSLVPTFALSAEEAETDQLPHGDYGRSTLKRGRETSQLGNAERLIDQHGQDIRYVKKWRKWVVWDGKRWVVDGNVVRLAQQTVRTIYDEAWRYPEDSDTRKALLRHAIGSEHSNSVRGLLYHAQAMALVQPDEFDLDPWLLNFNNGTLDLRSGRLRPHQRADLVTKLIPGNYDAGAGCPTWEKFLERALPDSESRAFAQRWAGYCLTGRVDEKCFLVIHGPSDAGKTRFVEALRGSLGSDYAQVLQEQDFLELGRSNGGNNDAMADLHGTRLAVVSETPRGAKLKVSTVKNLTGGGQLAGMRKWERRFLFTPTHKLVIDTNHRPKIPDPDNAIWNRVKMLPFKVVIPRDEQDKRLGDKFTIERAGIIAWMVRGCLGWQRTGLAEPESSRTAQQEYRKKEDDLGRFIEQCCVVDPDRRVTRDLLRSSFASFIAGAPARGWVAQLQETYGVEPTNIGGVPGWKGIGLKGEVTVKNDKNPTF